MATYREYLRAHAVHERSPMPRPTPDEYNGGIPPAAAIAFGVIEAVIGVAVFIAATHALGGPDPGFIAGVERYALAAAVLVAVLFVPPTAALVDWVWDIPRQGVTVRWERWGQ